MEETEGLTNMERFYEAQADSALDAFNKGDFDTCDKLSSGLLMHARLPPLWRAQCNLLLATTADNTALEYANAAVKWYNRLLEEDPKDEYLLKNHREATLLVRAGEKRQKKIEEEAEKEEGEAGQGVGEDGEAAKTADEEAGAMEALGGEGGVKESVEDKGDGDEEPDDVERAGGTAQAGENAGVTGLDVGSEDVMQGIEEEDVVPDSQQGPGDGGPALPKAIRRIRSNKTDVSETESRLSRASTVVPQSSQTEVPQSSQTDVSAKAEGDGKSDDKDGGAGDGGEGSGGGNKDGNGDGDGNA